MFSKLLAFGLGTLTLVQAAPAFTFQTPMISCAVNVGSNIAAPKPLAIEPPIEPGRYIITNPAFGDLINYNKGDQIYGARSGYPPALGEWIVQSRGGNQYTITNAGSNAVAYASDGLLLTRGQFGDGDTFIIDRAGNNFFTIQVPDEDQVWTFGTPVRLFPNQGGNSQRWKFVPIFD